MSHRDGRLQEGDELVNVSGARLRSVSPAEARKILDDTPLEVDIVVARIPKTGEEDSQVSATANNVCTQNVSSSSRDPTTRHQSRLVLPADLRPVHRQMLFEKTPDGAETDSLDGDSQNDGDQCGPPCRPARKLREGGSTSVELTY